MRAALLERLLPHIIDDVDDAALKGEWQKFRELYSNWYVERHDAVMNLAGGKLDEYLSSNAWVSFSDLATRRVGGREMERAMKLIREIRSLKCCDDVRPVLE